jgi:hypothetical protein
VRMVAFLVLTALSFTTAAMAGQESEYRRFVILRNGDQIGTNTIYIRCNGSDMSVDISTAIAVKFGFLTLYRFDQTERERWIDGRFASMGSTTDDDGTVHHVRADVRGAGLSVIADGKTQEMPGNLLPSSLWNPMLARQTASFSTINGKLMRVAVTDDGAQNLSLDGRQIAAQHYSLHGLYSQEVWYDSRGNLVRLQLRASDGSTILYRPIAP